MLNLPNVTLVVVDCLNAERAAVVIEKSMKGITFGAVKLLTDKPIANPYRVEIGPIKNLVEYSIFCLRDLYKYIDTDYLITVQHDGWILHPEAWEADWPRYDYIGPLFFREHPINNKSVGSGGFSFRSRKLMEHISKKLFHLYGPGGYMHEDGFICKGVVDHLANAGFAFAPPDRAAKFAYGGNPAHFCQKPFGFHGFYALRALDKEYDDFCVKKGVPRV